MKFDLRTPLLGFDGKPVKEQVQLEPGEVPKPGESPRMEAVKFRAIIHAAIYRRPETGAIRTPEEVERIGLLGLKIWKRWKVELDHKDCDFILEKAKISFASDPLYYIRLKEFLEGQEPDVPETDEEDEEDRAGTRPKKIAREPLAAAAK